MPKAIKFFAKSFYFKNPSKYPGIVFTSQYVTIEEIGNLYNYENFNCLNQLLIIVVKK
jgi:hypothetical protein